MDALVLVNLKARVFELGKVLELSIWSILHEGIKETTSKLLSDIGIPQF